MSFVQNNKFEIAAENHLKNFAELKDKEFQNTRCSEQKLAGNN